MGILMKSWRDESLGHLQRTQVYFPAQWLTAASNSNFGASDALFWPVRALHIHGAHKLMEAQAYIYIHTDKP